MGRWVTQLLAIAVVVLAAVAARAGDDWGDGRTFDGEPSDWRPLDSMMNESDEQALKPSATIGGDDDDDAHGHQSHAGELKDGLPVDDDSVQSAPLGGGPTD